MADFDKDAYTQNLETQLLDLADQLNRLQRKFDDQTLYQLAPMAYDDRIPPPEVVELVGASQVSGATKVAIRWVRPSDPNISHFEIWAKRLAYDSESWFQVLAVADSPASFTITADKDTPVVFSIRTVMKNGLALDLNACPTVTANIYLAVSEVPDESIGDAKLDRTTDPINILDGDINSLSFSKVTGVSIEDSDIVSVSFSKCTSVSISDSDIGTLHANQLIFSGQTLNIDSGITYSGSGTFTISSTGGLALSAGRKLSMNGNTIEINGGTLDIGASGLAISGGGTLSVSGATSLASLQISGVACIGPGRSGSFVGINAVNNSSFNTETGSAGGYQIKGTTVINADRDGSFADCEASGEFKMDGSTVINASRIFVGTSVNVDGTVDGAGGFYVDGTQVINPSDVFVSPGGIDTAGNINTTSAFKVSGTQVVGAQGSAVVAASESHACGSFAQVNDALDNLGIIINLLRGRLQGHGLIAT